MRAALIVGINHYQHHRGLHGCVEDAKAVKAVLAKNEDGSKNFDCRLLSALSPNKQVRRRKLKDEIKKLFSIDAEVALLYFSGHGAVEDLGGYLIASDSHQVDEGVSLNEVLMLANKSPARNKIIVLDSCHSGAAGALPYSEEMSTLAEGLIVLTASSKKQHASENLGGGVFTSLFVDALMGSAANLTGDVTPGAIYAHIDQSLGAWGQRPLFKANVSRFLSLRKTKPPISIEDLRRIPECFPNPGDKYQLDPTYEPEMKGRDPGMPKPVAKNTKVFALLQKYNRLNLLVPVGAPHMWHAAMQSKSCKLTVLGEHYRRLAVKKLL